MATTTGYVDFTEQTTPASPSASHQRYFIDSSDHLPKVVNSSGTVSVLRPVEFAAQQSAVATSETTTSATFADLTTPGPSVTVTVGASGKVKISVGCQMQNSGANQDFVGVVVSGANTVAAATLLSTGAAAGASSVRQGNFKVFTGLSTGSTTFKMQYAVGAGTGTFQNREILAEALP